MTELQPNIAQRIFDKIEAHDKSDNIRFGNIDDQLTTINEKQDKLLDAVIGNEKYGQQGVVKRMVHVEKEVEKINTTWNARYNKLLGIIAAIVFVGTPVTAIIFLWIQNTYFK